MTQGIMTMERVITQDQSVTFRSEQYQETYHSISGAQEEAIKKFSEPCHFETLAQQGQLRILDVCFGLGYNTGAALDAIYAGNPNCNVWVVGLENDPAILQKMLEIDATVFRSYAQLQTIIKTKQPFFFNEIITVHEPLLRFELLLGDARERIKLLENFQFDCVFLDPFSPQKCPELWTLDFFKDIFASMKSGGILTTYSCARTVRDNLAAAGFGVKDGPVVGRKAPATIAIKR